LKVKVTIKGISPMLMNPATEELLDQLEGTAGARKIKDTESTPKERAEKKVIKGKDGKVGVPQEYLTACLIEAGRQMKVDAKRNISTKESTLLYSFLSIEEIFFPFKDQSFEWETDRRKGTLNNAGKKVAVCITRPRFDEWAFDATFVIREKELAESKVKELLEKAGTGVGLGDFRPACRGPFGRFEIAKWEVVDG
jgi:hypothetical protein